MTAQIKMRVKELPEPLQREARHLAHANTICFVNAVEVGERSYSRDGVEPFMVSAIGGAERVSYRGADYSRGALETHVYALRAPGAAVIRSQGYGKPMIWIDVVGGIPAPIHTPIGARAMPRLGRFERDTLHCFTGVKGGKYRHDALERIASDRNRPGESHWRTPDEAVQRDAWKLAAQTLLSLGLLKVNKAGIYSATDAGMREADLQRGESYRFDPDPQPLECRDLAYRANQAHWLDYSNEKET